MRSRDGSPLWLTEGSGASTSLRRLDLGGSASSSRYDERWLQNELFRHPEVFPTEQIEPGFGTLIPLCRELPLHFGGGRSGALDNVFVTRDGGLVLVEAKLWRNPEARRTVVAQAMEYGAAVFRLGYSEFERAVLKARGSEEDTTKSLFSIAAAHSPGIYEAEFVDAVSRNLARGRAIIAVVGDGIREDIIPLVSLLQSHAGHRFTFALVELAIYETPEPGVRLMIPSILTQTTLIERGVVQINNIDVPGVHVEVMAPSAPQQTTSTVRRIGISEDEFFEFLGRQDMGLPPVLRAFLTKAEALNVYPEFKGGLNLKHASPNGQPLNFAAINKEGYVDTSPSTWFGRKDYGLIYNETMAAAIGGFVNTSKTGEESFVRTRLKRTPRLSDFLPLHEKLWLEAIETYIRASLSGAITE